MRRLSLLGAIAALALALVTMMPAPAAEAWGSRVYASYLCVGGKITATLQWTGNSPYAVGQYVEMSYTDNGWKRHTTTSVGPYHPSVNAMAWDGLQPITRHFLRFTQQYADGSWDESLTFRFDTPSCAEATPAPVVQGMDTPTKGIETTAVEEPAIPACHPSYSGVCLNPTAADYDCEGEDGDGPLYIRGPFEVVGPDAFGLDGDTDGVGCEGDQG